MAPDTEGRPHGGRNERELGPAGARPGAPQLASLYRDFNARLVSDTRRFTNTWQDAEDAAAEAWRILHEKGCPHADARWWLKVVARHEAFDARRKRLGERLDDGALAALTPAPTPRRDDALDLLHAVGRLHPMQRYALARQAAGLSYHEIVAESGRTYTWVNRHLAEGRAALREAVAA